MSGSSVAKEQPGDAKSKLGRERYVTASDGVFISFNMTRDERSFLLYAETCCVDYGGLLEGERMNADDHAAAAEMVAAELMRFGRMPAALLGNSLGRTRTHWCELTSEGWALAHMLRVERSRRRGPLATAVFEEIAERESRDSNPSPPEASSPAAGTDPAREEQPQ